MPPPMYRIFGITAICLVFATFFLGLAHLRAHDCEKRRLEIISALNAERDQQDHFAADLQIAYSPGELLKKLAGPREYEKQLIQDIKEGRLRVPQITKGELLISENLYVIEEPQVAESANYQRIASPGP